MKRICAILITIVLMLTIFPMSAFAEGKATPTPEETPINHSPVILSSAATESEPTDTSGSTEPSSGGVTLSIDNTHKYEGMDKAYKNGYVPAVKDGKATIVLPLIASGKLKGNSLTATPNLGEPSASPFVFKSYQITVKQKDNPVGNGANTVSSYLVLFELPLASGRLNGVYPVSIDIAAKGTDGGEVVQSFTIYVTITDGKKPTSDEPVIPKEPEPEKPTSQPKVIVSGYEINPSPVIAGKEFTAKVTLKNTNEKKSVQNMTVSVSCESPNLTLLNDSDTIFISKLGKGATTEFELKYKADLETPAMKYSIALAISYDNSEATALTSTGAIEVIVAQALNVKMEPPKMAAEINVGDTMPLSIQVMNLGRSMVYNVRVELSAPGLLPSGTAFVGNMEAGTALEGKMDVFVGTKDMSEGYGGKEKYGLTKGTLTLIYEDNNGQEFRDSIDISTTIHESVISTTSAEQEEKPQMASQWWISIVIGGIVLGALAALLLIRRKNSDRLQRRTEETEMPTEYEEDLTEACEDKICPQRSETWSE